MPLSQQQTKHKIIIQNQTFHDIDQLSTILNNKRYYHLTPLTKAPFQYNLNFLDFGIAQLVKIKSSSVLQARGHKSQGFIEFVCLFNDNTAQPYYSHGIPMNCQHLFGFDYNREVDSILPAYMELAIFRIEKNFLQNYLEILDRPDIDYRFFDRNHIFLPESRSKIQIYLNRVFQVMETSPQTFHKKFLDKLILENFIPLLIDSIPFPSNTKSLLLTPNFRAKLFQEATAFMIAHLDQPITLKDICLALNAGSRTISYGFQHVVGLSPIKYFKILRLNQIYQRLKKVNPYETTIEEIANQYGFWSLGHFSRDYKKFFGELPSITLNRTY